MRICTLSHLNKKHSKDASVNCVKHSPRERESWEVVE